MKGMYLFYYKCESVKGLLFHYNLYLALIFIMLFATQVLFIASYNNNVCAVSW